MKAIVEKGGDKQRAENGIKANGTERMSFPNVSRQSPPKDTRLTYLRKAGVCENTSLLLIARQQTAKTISGSKRT